MPVCSPKDIKENFARREERWGGLEEGHRTLARLQWA
jgi:hypothetical protein